MTDLDPGPVAAAGVSPTQRALHPSDVARLVGASFGPRRQPVDCGPLAGGGFAAVWWVDLDDGRRVVLKVAPRPETPLLRYERRLIAAEARYFRLVAARAPGVPVPRVLHHGADPRVLDGDWLFTVRLPGRPLSALSATGSAADDAPVRAAFGAFLAELHSVTDERFGYDDGRTGAPTWRGAFAAIVDDLLADAADWRVELPVPAGRIRDLVRRNGEVLDAVDRPALLQFDGWDGNVLAARDSAGALRMTGLVDGERYLFGDPLMDLVSPALYRRIEDEPDHPLLLGYAAAAGSPPVLDEAARRRLTLYRLYLYLLMTVEMPSRNITREARPDRHARLADLLDEQLTELGR
jgi:aminoglycoside phosphotransferase (APT) family kinase protein